MLEESNGPGYCNRRQCVNPYHPETNSATGQDNFNRLATIPVALIPGLDHDHA
jgi:hypothetical protein